MGGGGDSGEGLREALTKSMYRGLSSIMQEKVCGSIGINSQINSES